MAISDWPVLGNEAMLKDFVVAADAVGVVAHGTYVDLHNEFDIAEIRCNPTDRAVELAFTRVIPSSADSPVTVVLQFLDVDWIQLSPHVLAMGNGGVEELGYKEPSDHDDTWLMREEQASPEAHFFLRLSNDEFVRLHARRAKAIL